MGVTAAATGQHLHSDDCPVALGLLHAILRGRHHPAFEPTDVGAYVDWEGLAYSWLSSTERAAALIAQACSVLERHGGAGPHLQRPLVDAVAAVVR